MRSVVIEEVKITPLTEGVSDAAFRMFFVKAMVGAANCATLTTSVVVNWGAATWMMYETASMWV